MKKFIVLFAVIFSSCVQKTYFLKEGDGVMNSLIQMHLWQRILFFIIFFLGSCGPSQLNYSFTVRDITLFPPLEVPPKPASFFRELEKDDYAIFVYYADVTFHLDDIIPAYTVSLTEDDEPIQYNPSCDYLRLPRIFCPYKLFIPGIRYSFPVKTGQYSSIAFYPTNFSFLFENGIPKMVKNFTFKKNVVYEFRFSLNKSYRLQRPYYLNNRYLLEISMYQIEDYVKIADNSALGILKSLKPPYSRGSIENTDRQDMKRHNMEANPTTGRLFYESFP